MVQRKREMNRDEKKQNKVTNTDDYNSLGFNEITKPKK